MCLKVSLLVVLALFGDEISLDLHERLLAKSIVVTLNCFSIHEFIMIKRKAFDSILHYGNHCNIQLALMEYLLRQQNFIPMTEKLNMIFIRWNWKASKSFVMLISKLFWNKFIVTWLCKFPVVQHNWVFNNIENLTLFNSLWKSLMNFKCLLTTFLL